MLGLHPISSQSISEIVVPAVSTYAPTHTSDSLLRKKNTTLHTTDSLLRKENIVTYTTDSLLRKENTATHMADSLLRVRSTVVHTTDSLLRRQNTKTHTADADLRSNGGAYTSEDIATLPTTDAQVFTTYTAADYTNVATDDNVYKDLTGANYLVEHFWQWNTNNTDEITATIKVKSSLAPTSSTVYLQIYNYTTPGWETLDSDAATAVDTEFTLTAVQTTSLSSYYTTGNKAALRVYQQAV